MRQRQGRNCGRPIPAAEPLSTTPRTLPFRSPMKVNSLAKEIPSNFQSVRSRDNPKAAPGPKTLDTNSGPHDEAYKTTPTALFVWGGNKTTKQNKTNNSCAPRERINKPWSVHMMEEIITTVRNRLRLCSDVALSRGCSVANGATHGTGFL